VNAREAALKVLVDTEEKGAYSNIALNKLLNGVDFNPMDKSLVTELVYGTLKNKILIDYYISSFSKIKLKKISFWILNILRIGIYQLLFSDKIPVSAACNESVKLAKKYGHSASSGFVNAILRNVARTGQNIKLPDRELDISMYLSVKYSHQKWMVDLILKEHGEEFTEELLLADNEVPKLSLRTNTLKTDRKSLIEILTLEGAKAVESSFTPEGIVVEGLASPANSKVFEKGYFQVQDESSMLVARVISPKKADLVVDVCSAPGGKTTHIAQLMNNEGRILAFDIHPHKLELVRENAKRLGINIIETFEQDAEIKVDSLVGKADCVLVDAPCSGLGIIRRKPDIKWTRKPEDIGSLNKIQADILKTSSSYVKPGGTLVYSTCTILREENQGTVNDFLSRNKDFYIESVEAFLEEPLKKYVSPEGYLQLYPNVQGADGFFICRLKRK
jgi:ribosomal RNA small subunit methyltransferase RsmB